MGHLLWWRGFGLGAGFPNPRCAIQENRKRGRWTGWMRHFSHDSHRGAERACAKRVGFVESRSGAAVGKGFEWARLPQVTIGEEILRAAPMTMQRREFEHDGMTLFYLDSGRNKDGDGKRADHASCTPGGGARSPCWQRTSGRSLALTVQS